MAAPSVTAVVTCYNQERTVASAIESVLAQTAIAQIDRIIVVDDGSTDRSAQIVDQLRSEHPLIARIHQRNGGAASARNAGIDASTGTHVAFLDGDDRWMPEKLAVQLPTVAALPHVGLFFSDFLVTDMSSQPARRSLHRARPIQHDDPAALRTLFLRGGSIVPSTSIVRRDVFATCGVFDTALRHNEDPDMWLRIGARFPMQHIPGVVTEKGKEPGSLGADVDANAAAQRYITDKIVTLRPDLGPDVARRHASIEMRTGYQYLLRGERRAASGHLWQALTAGPLDRQKAQALLYLCLAAIPGDPERNVRSVKRLLPTRDRN